MEGLHAATDGHDQLVRRFAAGPGDSVRSGIKRASRQPVLLRRCLVALRCVDEFRKRVEEHERNLARWAIALFSNNQLSHAAQVLALLLGINLGPEDEI